MPDLKILFLSTGDQLYRCQIAKNILQSFDATIKVYSAGIPPITDLLSEKIKVMELLGFEIKKDDFKAFDEYQYLEFDYLITVSHGLREKLGKYPRNYRIKLHMEFPDWNIEMDEKQDVVKALRNIRDEIENELDYFYYHVLNKNR